MEKKRRGKPREYAEPMRNAGICLPPGKIEELDRLINKVNANREKGETKLTRSKLIQLLVDRYLEELQ